MGGSLCQRVLIGRQVWRVVWRRLEISRIISLPLVVEIVGRFSNDISRQTLGKIQNQIKDKPEVNNRSGQGRYLEGDSLFFFFVGFQNLHFPCELRDVFEARFGN